MLNEWECYFVCKGWALIIQRECFWWTRSICSFILLLRFIILLWFHSFIMWNFECVFFKQIITVWNFCCYKETNGVNRLSSLMQRSKVVIAAFFVCLKVLRILSSSLIKHTYTHRERGREGGGWRERHIFFTLPVESFRLVEKSNVFLHSDDEDDEEYKVRSTLWISWKETITPFMTVLRRISRR